MPRIKKGRIKTNRMVKTRTMMTMNPSKNKSKHDLYCLCKFLIIYSHTVWRLIEKPYQRSPTFVFLKPILYLMRIELFIFGIFCIFFCLHLIQFVIILTVKKIKNAFIIISVLLICRGVNLVKLSYYLLVYLLVV